MGLPKIEHPIFELTLPSTKQIIKFRPFLVKEEKLLLIAQAGGDAREMLNAIRQVVTNCILTEGVDVDQFASFDLEYFFLKLRAKSVSNVVELTYRDNEDEKLYTFNVDLDSVEITYNPNHRNVIDVPQGYKLKLKYPTSKSMDQIIGAFVTADVLFEIIKVCADVLYKDSEVYNFSEYTVEEIDEFISSLPVQCLQELREFATTLPQLSHDIVYTNSLGNERKIVLQTLDDFFTLG